MKKVLSIINSGLICTLALSYFGCGNEEEENDSPQCSCPANQVCNKNDFTCSCAPNTYGKACFPYGSVTAEDGNTYKTFRLGNLEWMAENLRNASVDHYSANYDSKNDSTYGLIYTWDNANKACPQGWRLPTLEEAEEFANKYYIINSFDTSAVRDSSWENGTNESGFSALPAGRIWPADPLDEDNNTDNSDFGFSTIFWLGTESNILDWGGYYDDMQISSSSIWLNASYHDSGYSVRCVKKVK